MSFHSIWKQWHIYNVRNVRVFDVDPGDYHLMDGIEDWIRPSMKLRAMSQRSLRLVQLENQWSDLALLEHLRGDHDGMEDNDEEIYSYLQYNSLENEAHKFIPEWRLKQIAG